MKKLILLTILILLPIKLNAVESYVVMDPSNGRVLASQNMNEEMLIASTTKVMTAIVALEHADPTSILCAGDEILKVYGSMIYLDVGECMPLYDLLVGLMLRSGNDAAMVIATRTLGYDAFIKEVNEENLFKNNGIDVIDFLVSFNKGEPLKPLNKVASGGELSRFMLALKSLSYQDISPKTFIFDEIDSGVSGEVAYNIALKIKSISLIHQVLCVTHLPQVASISDYQLDISKQVIDENRTITNIKVLDYNDRIESIAKMISDGEATQASIALAKELLEKKRN